MGENKITFERTEISVEQTTPATLMEHVQVVGQALAIMMKHNPLGGTFNWALVIEPITSEGKSMAVGVMTTETNSAMVEKLLQAGILRLHTTETPQS